MNIKELEKILCNFKQESIDQIAEQCFCNPQHAKFITFIIEQEIQKINMIYKLQYLILIDKIINLEIMNKRKEIQFIKSFSFRMKQILLQFLVANNIQDLDMVFNIINKWEKEQIYHSNFTINLREILFPLYDKLQLQNTKKLQNQNEEQFILDSNLKIVQTNNISVQYYNLLLVDTHLENKIQEFNTKKDTCKKMKDLKQNLEEGEKIRQQFLQYICQIQNFYFNLSKIGEELINEDKKKLDYYIIKRKKLKT